MFSGYHPDAWWDPSRRKENLTKTSTEQPSAIPEEELPEISGFHNDVESKVSEPEVVAVPDAVRLLALIEAQGIEIERLRNLVEGTKTKDE